MADTGGKPGITASLEQAIRALIDPFLPKGKGVPPPAPVRPVVRPVVPPPVKVPPAPHVPPKPVPVAPLERPKLTITGIIFNSARPMAIINGEVFEQGQSIPQPKGEARITRIDKGSVQVLYSGTSFTFATDQGE